MKLKDLIKILEKSGNPEGEVYLMDETHVRKKLIFNTEYNQSRMDNYFHTIEITRDE